MFQQLGFSVLLFMTFVIRGSCREGSMDLDFNLTRPIKRPPKLTKPTAMSQQSPINLHTADAVPKGYPPLRFHGHFHLSPENSPMIKNDHGTVQIGESRRGENRATMTGGPLNGTAYRFAQCHFHWGNQSDVGSEHTVDGHPYSMEVHCVHHNTKYDSVDAALGQADGICVVAFFLKASPKKSADSNLFNLIVRHLSRIQKDGSEDLAEPTILSVFKPYATPNGWHTYIGSLTTPPYTENVRWIAYPGAPVQVTDQQVGLFRHLKDNHGAMIGSNFREIQPLNGRTISMAQKTQQ
ncbi:unnamed protein product [Bemisia tabaci]|uniref:Alpha-carbonic anhydrase domain-containing protein n=2 Tax=Bemisia tabaci TaxID=7038 RepID=A0A9P0F9R5_BEMTA|nr:unnamed protein product [Bemisia tabaci]